MKPNDFTLRLFGHFIKSATATCNSCRRATHLLSLLFVLMCLGSFAGNIDRNNSSGKENFGTPNTESMRINLYLLMANSTTILADGVLTEYDNLYHDSVTYEDAYKFTNIKENLGLCRYGHVLAVERRPIISTLDTVFLKLWKTTARNYQFEFLSNSLNHPGMQALLEDTYLGTSTSLALSGSTKINFSINADASSANVNRFRIVYRDYADATPLPVNFDFVKTYSINNKISVAWKVENEINIDRYEVENSFNGVDFTIVNSIGVAKSNGAGNIYSWIDQSPFNGINFYRIRGIDRDGSKKFSPIVKSDNTMKGNKGSFMIYPNPIKGNIINVKFANQPAGTYQVRLINNNGQILYSGSLPVSGNYITQTISTSKKLSGGIYQLEIKAPDNTINVQQAIVQE